jgi:hypothetical protein
MMHISELVQMFKERTLPRERWTREAHLLVALWYVYNDDSLVSALAAMRKDIKAYNMAVGVDNTATSGYHETVTTFWMIQLAKFCHQNMGDSIEELIGKLLASELSEVGYITRFYSVDTLKCSLARQYFVGYRELNEDIHFLEE